MSLIQGRRTVVILGLFKQDHFVAMEAHLALEVPGLQEKGGSAELYETCVMTLGAPGICITMSEQCQSGADSDCMTVLEGLEWPLPYSPASVHGGARCPASPVACAAQLLMMFSSNASLLCNRCSCAGEPHHGEGRSAPVGAACRQLSRPLRACETCRRDDVAVQRLLRHRSLLRVSQAGIHLGLVLQRMHTAGTDQHSGDG